MHPKGTVFPADALFLHFGTLLGLLDCVVTELLCEMKTVKKGERGYCANVDRWSKFKFHNHFSSTDIEITTCQLDHDHLWFLKDRFRRVRSFRILCRTQEKWRLKAALIKKQA